MQYTLETLKAQFNFWGAYRHLKAKHEGWRLRHPSWAGILHTFNNPPVNEMELANARIAELEAQVKALQAELEQAQTRQVEVVETSAIQSVDDLNGCLRFYEEITAAENAYEMTDIAKSLVLGSYGKVAQEIAYKATDYYRLSILGQMLAENNEQQEAPQEPEQPKAKRVATKKQGKLAAAKN